MFPTVDQYHGWRIERRPPGFEFTPGLLGKITTYVAVGPDGGQAIFAFMYSFLVTGGPRDKEAELAESALAVVHLAIETGGLRDRSEHTYELSAGGWVVVQKPGWWISVVR